METVKQLDDSQLEGFDWEFIDNEKRMVIFSMIKKDFPDGKFSFIDIGGGNGSFTDRVLQEFPESEGLIIDNSELLLNRNAPNSRKSIICDSVEKLDQLVDKKYDIVFFNLILHHLVGSDYSSTRAFQRKALSQATKVLKENGKISIFENIYDGSIFDSLPSHMIFNLTSSKILKSLVSKLGANTAGVGVCFLSKANWLKEFNNVGLEAQAYSDHREFNINKIKKIILHLGYIRGGQFWCQHKSG